MIGSVISGCLIRHQWIRTFWMTIGMSAIGVVTCAGRIAVGEVPNGAQVDKGEAPPMLAVLGIASSVPGIGIATYEVCYSDSTGLVAVRGTTDDGPYYGTDKFEFVLQVLAAHNVSVRDELQTKHLSNCSPEEDWDKLVGSLAQVSAQQSESREVQISLVTTGAARKGYVTVRGKLLPNQITVRDVCKAIASVGIRREVRVEALSLDNIGLVVKRQFWTCLAGSETIAPG